MDLLNRTQPTETHERPWGSELWFVQNSVCTVKILIVKPGQILSDQRHQQRSELWFHLNDGATVNINGVESEPAKNTETWIPQGTWHRLGAKADAPEPVRVLEIMFGQFDQNDIERRSDKYGRV